MNLASTQHNFTATNVADYLLVVGHETAAVNGLYVKDASTDTYVKGVTHYSIKKDATSSKWGIYYNDNSLCEAMVATTRPQGVWEDCAVLETQCTTANNVTIVGLSTFFCGGPSGGVFAQFSNGILFPYTMEEHQTGCIEAKQVFVTDVYFGGTPGTSFMFSYATCNA